MSLPKDLKTAYETFTLLAIRHGYTYAGLMLSENPPSISVIGNVNERGHDLATLLREYADLVDEKTTAGMVETENQLANLN